MIKVGLTGNMGSGKTTVARIFETLGVPVYHADEEAKKFLKTDDVVKKLSDRFGKHILTRKMPDRKKLAAIVFNDNKALAFLNSVIHPLVREDLKKWLDRNQSHSYVIHEAAILFESGFYLDFDKIITVTAPKKLSIQRLIERDKMNITGIEKRMQHQWEQERKIGLSDFVIVNDENYLVIPQVLEIHKILNNKKGYQLLAAF
jgi:dephospho-CoA kinase